MRICLVSHGFPPYERTGVENYTAGLARALVRAGQRVEVFAPRRAPELGNLCMRREERDGYAITWLATNTEPADPAQALEPAGRAQAFGRFLDCEQPEIVHFQHLVKLGLGLVAEAKRRALPVVYTAHDYYAFCHRFTWMRPDLTCCSVQGNARACAACDLALGLLNRQTGLGDYQVGVLPAQLERGPREALAGVLALDVARSGIPEAEWSAAEERRAKLDELRARTYAELDLVLAPTRYLADRLAAGGLARERIDVLGYGLDNADLESLAPPARRAGAPLRFGFLGGLSKHKGVHVLLEAFAELERPAELAIHGDSSDRPYVELLRERAAAVGARMGGAFAREGLRERLAQIDVVVVPSIWVENQPLVIREAFAARRPVVVSALGALPESVREGVDGLLFEPGNARDLARVLRRFCDEPELLASMSAAIQPQKSAAQQVEELVPIYARLVGAQRARAVADLPAHLAPVAAAHAELSRAPTRDLYARVMAALPRLGRALGLPEEPAGAVLARAYAHGSRALDELADLYGEREWLRRTIADTDLHGLRRELDWLRGVVDEHGKEREWLSSQLETQQAELAWLRETVEGKDSELEWRREQARSTEAETNWLRGTLGAKETELAWLHKERGERARADAALVAALLARENELAAALAAQAPVPPPAPGAASPGAAPTGAASAAAAPADASAEAARAALAHARQALSSALESARALRLQLSAAQAELAAAEPAQAAAPAASAPKEAQS